MSSICHSLCFRPAFPLNSFNVRLFPFPEETFSVEGVSGKSFFRLSDFPSVSGDPSGSGGVIVRPSGS